MSHRFANQSNEGPPVRRGRKLALGLGVFATPIVLLMSAVALRERHRAIAQKRQAEVQKMRAVGDAARARSLTLFAIGNLAGDPATKAEALRQIAAPVPSGWLSAAVAASHATKAYGILEGHTRAVS